MSHRRNGKNNASENGKKRQVAQRTDKAQSLATQRLARRSCRTSPVLITGGAGFIGTNLAHRLLSSGIPVMLFDNLSRPGVEKNVEWLLSKHGELVQIEIGDVRNGDVLEKAVRKASAVFHFAAQVAVTTSLIDPMGDFEVNALGMLNMLERLRHLRNPPPLVFTSTNKVYGALEDLKLVKHGNRYQPEDPTLRASGISEECQLDFHSPYGCSKGGADQYVLDYARTFHLPALVFRMSCIYGPHQFGTEDQGWVAHFLIRSIEGTPITLYGDGMQVRDILFVEDLVDAFLLAQENINNISGQAFNIGGGAANSISLLELIDLIGELNGQRYALNFEEWRLADQRFFVSDTRKFQRATGWSPRVGVRDGVERLYHWLIETRAADSQRHNDQKEGTPGGSIAPRRVASMAG